MSKETVNSKEAAFMLDTDIEQDMQTYTQEITALAIKFINSTPQLYKNIKAVLEQNQNIKFACQGWAKEHDDEFGDLFITELDSVDWAEVSRRV